MSYSLPPLPYTYEALEPYIDAATMHLHHDKHHQTYVDKLNAAVASQPQLASQSVEDLLRNLAAVPEEVRGAVKNHGGGHSNHSLFWTLLSGEAQTPSDSVKQALTTAFGSFAAFQEKFSTAAANHFGSGWVWLIKTREGKLDVKSYLNQDSPFSEGALPILAIDVWEHAYYLKYQNRRADYIAAFWQVVNWQEVEKRLAIMLR